MKFRTLAAAAVIVTALAACEKDPNEASTWIPKLKDANEFKEAVRNLERLKDLKAITPLGEAWVKWNKPSNALVAIINISKFDNKNPKKGPVRGPDYTDALPWLKKAVQEFDPGDPTKIADATLACEALGNSRDPSAVETLVGAATKAGVPVNSGANKVKAAAILALGKFKDPRAVDALIMILETDPETQLLGLNAAAAIALAETGDEKALGALIKGMFLDRIYQQVRGGITRIGPPAVPMMVSMFKGTHTEMNTIAKEKKFDEIAPGAIKFKAAIMLGDLRATAQIPLLLDGLKEEKKSIFIQTIKDKKGNPLKGDDGKVITEPSPVTQHNGILDSLRHLGPDPRTADAVWAYYVAASLDMKPMVLDVYSMVSPFGELKARDEIWKLVVKGPPNVHAKTEAELVAEGSEHDLRLYAVLAFGRIARTKEDADKIGALAKTWEDKAKAAETASKAKNISDEEYDKYDAEKTLSEAWGAKARDAEASINAVVECKDDPLCLAKLIEAKDAVQGKPGMAKAERALLELSRLGPKAEPAKKLLLDNVKTEVGIIREMILLALPRVVTLPCSECADKLREVIRGQESQSTLTRLTVETRIIYHYFLSNTSAK